MDVLLTVKYQFHPIQVMITKHIIIIIIKIVIAFVSPAKPILA